MKTFLAAGIFLVVANAFCETVGTPEAAFETLKSLEGKWNIHSDNKILPIEMVYQLGSKGSIVTEQFGKELSVFYRDHQAIMMIHFCNAGNQPRLKLRESSAPGVLQFDAFDVSNLASPDAPHVQRIVYRVLDATKMDLEIIWQRNGKQEAEKYRLTKN